MSSRRPPLGLLYGAVIHGIRRTKAGYAVIRVKQLHDRQREEVVEDGLTEQQAEGLAMRLNSTKKGG